MDLSLLQSSPVIASPKPKARTVTVKKVGRPLKYPSVKLMSTLVDRYFNRCDAEHRPYTITGLALALDMNREQLIQYQEREEFQDTIKKAKQRVAAYAEEQLFRHGGQVTGIIFSLKNNFGWKDAVEHTNRNLDLTELLLRIEASNKPIID